METSSLFTTLINHPDMALILIWKCNIPLKVICFNWLCLSERINTWDNLNKNGWIGPNCCSLCKCVTESVNHIFAECCFYNKCYPLPQFCASLSYCLERIHIFA